MIPRDWLTPAHMQRIIFHWTAGGHRPTALDAQHYHILIDGTGELHRGKFPIAANERPVKGAYAAHTLNCNTGSIGVALCGMRGAAESPFNPGPEPINEEQWISMMQAGAELCRFYGIAVDQKTTLGHGEVQQNLGIKQRGKWDPGRWPWAPSVQSAAVYRSMREGIKECLA